MTCVTRRQCKENKKYIPENILCAEYSCDKRIVVNKIESSLATILRERVWMLNIEENIST